MTEPGSRYLQYVATFAGNLNMVACGAILSWPSPTLPKLSQDPISPDNQLGRPTTKDEGSWIASLVPLGVVFGCFVSGYIGELLGHKRALLANTFTFIVGWTLIGTATSIYQIYVGRFILGLGIATSFTSLPIYTSEISEVSIRGTTGSLLQFFLTTGFLFSYSIGPFVSFTAVWLLCIGIHLLFFICFTFVPESPYFLVSRGREAEAVEALARFRGKSPAGVQNEIKKIQVEIDEALKANTGWRDIFRDKVSRKSIILTSILMTFQEFMGIDVVLFYVEDIFRDAGTKNTAMSAIIIGMVQLVASTVTPMIVDKSGRKILLVISSLGGSITLTILGAYFFMKELGSDLSGLTWVPLATLITYIIVFCLGWGPLPWAIMGEMFAPGVKSKASSVCVCSLWSFSFLLTKLFSNIEEAFGTHVGFWFFAVCSALNVIYVLALFPETKGKTVAEIHEKLSKGTPKIEIANVYRIRDERSEN